MTFRSRTEAGELLAAHVAELLPVLQPNAEGREGRQTIVLAIPKGGIPVAIPIARALHAPLDVWLAHKISAPGNPEFAVGSISINGEVFLDHDLVKALRISQDYIDAEIAHQRARLDSESIAYRDHRAPLEVRGKNVILVDDGVATGATALAALASLRREGAARRILATPVAPLDTASRLEMVADELIALRTPRSFDAVGSFYQSFPQLTLEEAAQLLEGYAAAH